MHSALTLATTAAPTGEPLRLSSFLPFVMTAAVAVVVLIAFHWLLLRRPKLSTTDRLPRQVTMIILTVVGIAAVLISLPLPDTLQGQIVGLFGVLVTGVIGLASTTLVANAMAGLMIRSVQSFRPGDFISVQGHEGRVSERGLFHVEIQTRDRDLMTLPNQYLIQNPIKVVRTSGTIVSTTLSLGYDVAHGVIETHLLKAAEDAGLEDPFVRVDELGDFSVTYRVAGFLGEVKQILTARSRLRTCVLDALHGARIEIVSPSFMNQRALDPTAPVIPPVPIVEKAAVVAESAPEERIFDKAETAEREVQLVRERAKIEEAISELKGRLKSVGDGERSVLEGELAAAQARLEEVRAEQVKREEEEQAIREEDGGG